MIFVARNLHLSTLHNHFHIRFSRRRVNISQHDESTQPDDLELLASGLELDAFSARPAKGRRSTGGGSALAGGLLDSLAFASGNGAG